MSRAFSEWVAGQVARDVVLTWDQLRSRHASEEVDEALEGLDDQALAGAAFGDAFEGATWT